MSIELPKVIASRVISSGRAAEGLFVRYTLVMMRMNNYVFNSGPTNRHGRTSLRYNDLIKLANAQFELGLMDYCRLDKWFSGTVNVTLLGADDIDRAIRAYHIYRDVYAFPNRYLQHLIAAHHLVCRLDPADVVIEAFAVPEGIRVTTSV